MVRGLEAKRTLALLGLAIVIFSVGYGLLLADLFVDGVDGWGDMATALMGGGLLFAMVIGAFALIELQHFLGKSVPRRDND